MRLDVTANLSTSQRPKRKNVREKKGAKSQSLQSSITADSEDERCYGRLSPCSAAMSLTSAVRGSHEHDDGDDDDDDDDVFMSPA